MINAFDLASQAFDGVLLASAAIPWPSTGSGA